MAVATHGSPWRVPWQNVSSLHAHLFTDRSDDFGFGTLRLARLFRRSGIKAVRRAVGYDMTGGVGLETRSSPKA